MAKARSSYQMGSGWPQDYQAVKGRSFPISKVNSSETGSVNPTYKQVPYNYPSPALGSFSHPGRPIISYQACPF